MGLFDFYNRRLRGALVTGSHEQFLADGDADSISPSS
jgi:hypothetical protein